MQYQRHHTSKTTNEGVERLVFLSKSYTPKKAQAFTPVLITNLLKGVN